MFKMPYTNLHELNLNWILNQLKKLLHMKIEVHNSMESSGDFDEASGTLSLSFPMGAVGPQGPQGPQGPGINMPAILINEPVYSGTIDWEISLNRAYDEYYKVAETFQGINGNIDLEITITIPNEPLITLYTKTFAPGETAYITIEVASHFLTIRDEGNNMLFFGNENPAGTVHIRKTVTSGWYYQRVETIPD